MSTALLRARYLAWTAADVVAMTGVAQENRQLDFKLIARPDFGRDDQSNLAKAVSGFSNAEGGVILWGVNARRDPNDDYIDQVVDAPGLDQARKVLARLNDLSSQASSPGATGLDHRLIEGGEVAPDFVATYVPEGDSGPYMAMLGDARHRYYRRIGSAFTPMDHSLVADMFGRRPQPALNLKLYQSGAGLLSAQLENVGRGVAVAPYLLFYEVQTPFHVWPFQIAGVDMARLPLPRTPPGSRDELEGFVGAMGHLIHPGLHLRFKVLQSATGAPEALAPFCQASFKFGAIGVPEQRGEFLYDFRRSRFETIEGASPIHLPRAHP